MKTFNLVTVTLWIFLAWTSQVQAKIARSNFSELLSKSDLILLAKSTKVDATNLSSSFAEFEVLEVFKGAISKKVVTVKFGHEEHDQPISKVGDTRLLFLRKVGREEYDGTQYGRSYWPLKQAVAPQKGWAAVYAYPVSMVRLEADNKAILKMVTFGEREPAEAIYVADIVAKIRGKKSEKSSVK